LGDFEKAKNVDKVNEKRPPITEDLPMSPKQNPKLQSLRQSQESLRLSQELRQSKD